MEVRFRAVARIAAARKQLTRVDTLTEAHADTVVLQVTQGNNGSAVGLDHHMIASERQPACRSPACLGECVADRWQAAGSCMIGFGIVHCRDDAVHRSQDGPTKAWKACAGSGYRSEANVSGAVRPESFTGTKSIANVEAYNFVPWLGTRFAGLF